MSDHPTDHAAHPEVVHPVAGILMVVILTALITLLVGGMNGGEFGQAAAAGLLFLGFGIFAVLGLGKVVAE